MSLNPSTKNTPTRTPNMPSSYKKMEQQNYQSLYKLHRSLFIKNPNPLKNKDLITSVKPRINSNLSNKRYEKYYGEKFDGSNEISQIQQINQQVAQVIKQLSFSYLMRICQRFQQCIKQKIEEMLSKFLILQIKIAQVQKKFNSIQILLHKKSKQIVTVIQQNQILINLNRDIEIRIQQLRQKYEISFLNVKNQWISNKIENFKNQLHQFSIVNKQCQSCRKGIKEKLMKQFNKMESYLLIQVNKEKQQNRKSFSNLQLKQGQKNLQKNILQQLNKKNIKVIKETLKQVIQIFYGIQNVQQSTFIGWKQKILQNIDLKFQILNLLNQKNIQNNFSTLRSPNLNQDQINSRNKLKITPQ